MKIARNFLKKAAALLIVACLMAVVPGPASNAAVKLESRNTKSTITDNTQIHSKAIAGDKDCVYIIKTSYGDKKVTGYFDNGMADRVFDLLNSYRVENGLTPLKKSSNLTTSAKIRAYESSYLFDHERPDYTKCFTVSPKYLYGENLAFGYYSAAGIMEGFKGSSTHDRIMRGKYYKTVGVAVFQAKQKNGDYIPYCVQHFGF